MKKIFSLIVILSMSILLTSCGQDTKSKSVSVEPTESTEVEEDLPIEDNSDLEDSTEINSVKDVGVEFDENILSVEITIPSSFYDGAAVKPTQEQLDEEAEDGMKSTLNEDGSVTIKMSKSVYKKKMEELSGSLKNEMDRILSDKDTYPSITDITANDDFTEFTVSSTCTSRSEFSMGENMLDFSLQISAMAYHMFLENPPGDAVVNWTNCESGQKIE